MAGLPAVVARTPLDAPKRALIEAAVRQHLDGHELEAWEIDVERDEEGEESIVVDLHYKLSPQPIDSANTVSMRGAVQRALGRSGDGRVSYLQYHFDKNQQIKDFPRA